MHYRTGPSNRSLFDLYQWTFWEQNEPSFSSFFWSSSSSSSWADCMRTICLHAEEMRKTWRCTRSNTFLHISTSASSVSTTLHVPIASGADSVRSCSVCSFRVFSALVPSCSSHSRQLINSSTSTSNIHFTHKGGFTSQSIVKGLMEAKTKGKIDRCMERYGKYDVLWCTARLGAPASRRAKTYRIMHSHS